MRYIYFVNTMKQDFDIIRYDSAITGSPPFPAYHPVTIQPVTAKFSFWRVLAVTRGHVPLSQPIRAKS